MKPLKQKRLINELYCLFIATGFLKIYIDETKSAEKELVEFYRTLVKKSLEYPSLIESLTIKATKIFDECESDLVKAMNEQKRFSKKIVLSEDENLEVHGLVFVASIIMEQEQLKDRVLNLPYSFARKVLNHFANSKEDIVLNSQVLSSYFIKKITKNK